MEILHFIDIEPIDNDNKCENKELYFEKIISKFYGGCNENQFKNDINTEKIIETLILENNTKLELSNLDLKESLDLRTFGNMLIKLKYIDCSNNYLTEIIVPNNEIIETFIFEPNPIKIIKFPYKYNKFINNLPDSLEQIIFCKKRSIFNQEINDLPSSLEYLQIGFKFNKQIDNLPENLKYLFLGENFNCEIKKLPSSLSVLIFDIYSNFNHELVCLPQELKFLSLPYCFSNCLIDLPNGLEYLNLGNTQQKIIIKNFPDTCYISFNKNF